MLSTGCNRLGRYQLEAQGITLVGNGGHALAIEDSLVANGITVRAKVDVGAVHPQKAKWLSLIADAEGSQIVFIAVGDNYLRQEISEAIREVAPQAKFASVVHPSAVVSSSATVKDGVFIGPLAHVGPQVTVGQGAVINSGARIEHGSTMSAFSMLAPGAQVGGNCGLGERSFLGMNSVMNQNTKIGGDTVVGAASLVNVDIGDQVLTYGQPCGKGRPRLPGEKFL